MENIAEAHEKSREWPLSATVKTASPSASHSIAACGGSGTPALHPAQKSHPDARYLWCDRTFARRTTGGSAQKFCCTAHRQQFWIAARRWTMRAIEVGLLSVDCLRASYTSVHAV